MSNLTTNDAAIQRESSVGNSEASSIQINSGVNRRTFLAAMGLGGAVLALSPLHLHSVFKGAPENSLLCVGSYGATDAGTLHLLQIAHGRARLLAAQSSDRPSAIVRHPSRNLLYVANDVSRYQHKPRGTVETFAVDEEHGTLALVGRQPLSLSAARPRSLAISPNGDMLVVAAFVGGAYNVLPIDASGLPSAPASILKQVGHGEHPTEQASAHPSHVLFHPGKEVAFAADYGSDRLDMLACGSGNPNLANMRVANRIPCLAGSGPSQIAIHPDGEFLVTSHALHPALTAFRISSELKLVATSHMPLHLAPTAICFSCEGNIFFAAHKRGTQPALLTAWSIDPQTGVLKRASEIALPASEVTSMHSANSTLWLASDCGILAVELSRKTRMPSGTARVSAIRNVRSMVRV
ncbi:MAG: beta-propeller fold lactonase family protein [Acidobacteriota bacterium]